MKTITLFAIMTLAIGYLILQSEISSQKEIITGLVKFNDKQLQIDEYLVNK